MRLTPASIVRAPALVVAVAGLVLGACGDGDEQSAASSTSSQAETTTTTTGPAAELTPCPNPEGFTLSMPSDWSTNEGDVLPRCSLFDPDPFEVPEGTDARVAAISARLTPVEFEVAANPDQARDVERRSVEHSGLKGVRLEYRTTGEGLYPEGTRVTMWVFDLAEGSGDGGSLVIDTVDIGSRDYERNQEVIDRMAPTVAVG